MAFEIKDAVRIFQPVLIGLWGGSSSGKTYSALRIARGLVGPQGKIGVIDTENRRALFYAGEVGGKWSHLDFPPDYTPQRMIEAFQTFENKGDFDCIIIDSISHIWEGQGGALESADNSTAKGLSKWAAPKMAIRRMLNRLIRSQMHVIFCLRAKNGVTQDSELKVRQTGLEPIMEKSLIFEMLVSVLLGPDQKPVFEKKGDGYFVNHQIPAIKAPAAIRKTIKPGEYLSEATGEAILAWLNSATRDIEDEARRAATRGVQAFRAWWPHQSDTHKAQLKHLMPELQAIAASADAETARQEAGEAPVEPQGAAESDQDEPFQDEFTPPTPAKPEPTPPAQKTPFELSVERFEKGLHTVDWLYYMSDDPASEKRGKKGVDALLALAQSLGEEFVAKFKAKQQEVCGVGQKAGEVYNAANHNADPFNDGFGATQDTIPSPPPQSPTIPNPPPKQTPSVPPKTSTPATPPVRSRQAARPAVTAQDVRDF